MMKWVLSLLISAVFFLSGCSPSSLYSPAESVTRTQVINIAQGFLHHRWTPTVENILHGRDSQGIFVNTPDASLLLDHPRTEGWWNVGETNTSIPYMWGGFDTPATFDEKLRAGLAAGDVFTHLKRKQLQAGVSKEACGIDCSGFISRCWRLPRHYSTRELPDICTQLSSFSDLQPGDIVNKHNDHVLLFSRFLDEGKNFEAYEVSAFPRSKVITHVVEVAKLRRLGFRPYRYRNIKD